MKQHAQIEGISFRSDVAGIEPAHLEGFFVDWPVPPSAEAHLAILAASHGIELALDDATGQVVGFINVISDGILSAYIPLLEVRPEYQGRGIGGTLIDRIVERYGTLYMLDLCCDKNVVPLYAAKGFIRVEGMVHRCWDPAPGSDYRPDDRTTTTRRP